MNTIINIKSNISDLHSCEVNHLLQNPEFGKNGEIVKVISVVEEGVHLCQESTGSVSWFIPKEDFHKCKWKIIGKAKPNK